MKKRILRKYDTDLFLTNLKMGYKLYDCCVFDDGDFNIYESDADYIDERDFKVREFKTKYIVYVWAKDKEHAKKIAFDKIAEYKAKKEGIII